MEKNDRCQSCARRARSRARWVLGVTLPRCAEVQVGGSVVASQRYAGTAAGMREREGKRGEEKRKKGAGEVRKVLRIRIRARR